MLCLVVSIRIVIVYIMDIIRRCSMIAQPAMDRGAGGGAEQQARCSSLTGLAIKISALLSLLTSRIKIPAVLRICPFLLLQAERAMNMALVVVELYGEAV